MCSKKRWFEHLSHVNPLFSSRPTFGAVLLFSLLATSCYKPEDGLGVDLLPPDALLNAVEVDTSAVVAWSSVGTPVRTSNLSRTLLGSYVDDRFGLANASIVTQVRLSTNGVGENQDPANLFCDSLVLSLVYDEGSYGYGNLDPQVVKVLELAEFFPNDTSYTSDRLPSVTSWNDLVVAGRDVFTPQPLSTPVIDGVTLKPQLRIPLDPALGQRFLSRFGELEMSTNEEFLKFFKGLWVLTDNGQQDPYQAAVLYMAMLDAQTKLTLYYRDVSVPDTLTFDFLINDNGVRFTHMLFDHAQAVDPGLPQALADTSLGQERIYVQSMGGVKSWVHFPDLTTYPEKGLRNLAKAELVIPLEGTYYPGYVPPVQLFLVRKGSDGQDLFLPDQLSAQGNIGGFYNPLTKEYRFIITRWAQEVLNGTMDNTPLSIGPGSNGVSMNRVVLSGPEHPERPMKLLLTFTTS